MYTSLYDLMKPKIIEPIPILCNSDPFTPDELREILQESKERMDKEMKMNRLYTEAGKYFVEKYSRGDE